jgi:hypothetical protein
MEEVKRRADGFVEYTSFRFEGLDILILGSEETINLKTGAVAVEFATEFNDIILLVFSNLSENQISSRSFVVKDSGFVYHIGVRCTVKEDEKYIYLSVIIRCGADDEQFDEDGYTEFKMQIHY